MNNSAGELINGTFFKNSELSKSKRMSEKSDYDKETFSTLIKILSLKYSRPIPKMNDQISLLISNIVFPNFNSQDLQSIKEKLQDSTKICDVLSKFEYYFPLIPLILQLIPELKLESDDSREYCIMYVTFSYITWRMYVEKTNNFELLPVILDAVSFVAIKTLSTLVVRVYIQIIEFYINSDAEFNLSLIIPSLEDMFYSAKKETCMVQTLLAPLLKVFLPKQDSPLTNDCEWFLEFIGFFPADVVSFITSDTAKSVIEKIYYHVSKLSLPSLEAFRCLASIAPRSNTTFLLSIFPQSLWKFISTNQKSMFTTELHETNIVIPFVHSYSNSLQFIDKPTFAKEIDTQKQITFDSVDVGKFLSNETKQIIDSVAAISFTYDSAATNMFKCINTIISDATVMQNRFDFTAAVIYLMSLFNLNEEQSADFIENMLKSPTFSVKYTLLDEKNQNPQINELRQEFFTVMAKNGFIGLVRLLENSVESPLIFGEAIIYIYSFFNFISPDILINPNLIRIISNASSIFTKLHLNASDESREAIGKIRIALFGFIKKTLNNQVSANIWFSNPNFMNFFISLLLEEPVRPFAICELRRYIATKSESFSSPLISSFVSAIELFSMHFPNKKHVELTAQLLEMTNSIIEQNNIIPSFFSEIISCTLSSLNDIDSNNELDFQFLEQLLIFLKNMKSSLVLSHTDTTSLETSIMKITDTKKQERVKTILLELFLNQKDKTVVDFAPIFPTIFKFEKLNFGTDEIISLLLSLTDNSYSNCCTLHNNDIDLFILDILSIYVKNKVPKQIAFQLIDIFINISSFCSSTTAIKRFFDFICPVEGKRVSIYYMYIVNKIYDAVKKDERMPKYIFPLSTPEPICRCHGLHLSFREVQVNVSFSFVFESTKMNQTLLFEIKKGDRSFLAATIEEEKLKISGCGFEETTMQNLSISYETVVSIAVINNKLAVSINGDTKVIDCEVFDDGKYDLIIGQNKAESKKPVLLTSFIVTQESKAIFELDLSGEELSFTSVLSSLDFKRNPFCCKPHHTFDFSDALINLFNAKPILILFSQLDYKNFAGEKINDIALTGICIFISLFRTTTKIQEYFLDFHFSNILAHLLSITDASHLTFDLYLAIFELVKEAKYKDLKLKILKKLMLDITIWIRSTSEIISQITTHWLRFIFPQFRNEFKSLLSVSSLLLALKEQSAIIAIAGNNEDKKTNEFTQRTTENIQNLILETSNHQFTPETFILFFSQCMLSPFDEHVKLFISIIDNILNTMKGPKEQLQKVGRCIPLLHSLLTTSDTDIFLSIIDIIHLSHKLEMITEMTLEQHISIIMDIINIEAMNEEILSKLIKKTNNAIPELTPLCCLIAISLGRGCVDKLTDELDFKILNKPDNSLLLIFWICALFGNASEDHKAKLIPFLFEGKISQFKTVCSVMKIVSLIMNIPHEELLHSFFTIVFNDVEKNYESYSHDQIIKILFNVYTNILFQTRGLMNMQLNTMFLNSPFQVNFQPGKRITQMCYELLDEKLKELIAQGTELVFGLRIESMKWADYDIALHALLLFEKDLYAYYANYDLLLCAFLLKYDKRAVDQHIKKLPPNFFQINAHPMLLQYFTCMQNNSIKTLDFLSNIAQSTPAKKNPKIIAQELSGELQQIFNAQQDIYSSKTNDMMQTMEKSNIEFVCKSKDKRMHNRDLWRSLWHELTQPFAPWRSLKELGPDIDKKWKFGDVFASNTQCPFSICSNKDFLDSLLIEKRKQTNEKISPKKQIRCTLISTEGYCPCAFMLNKENIVLQFEGSTKMKKIQYSNILRIEAKKYDDQNYALEITTRKCKKLFLSFHEIPHELTESIFMILENNKELKFVSLDDQIKELTEKTNMWVNGEITNFEYLIAINICAGKSFNTIKNYPFFPLVIKDVSSPKLDIQSESTYFDITKKQENSVLDESKVVFFLQRIEPFTTFWTNSNSESTEVFSSIKEIIEQGVDLVVPQFYYMPEFLTNINWNDAFRDVELPAWCRLPMEFIRMNREALESKYVSDNLNVWIDNYFGVNSKDPIFTAPHPKRNVKMSTKKQMQQTISFPSTIMHACCIEKNDMIKGTVALNNGRIINATINFHTSSLSSQTFGTYTSTEKKELSGLIPAYEEFIIVTDKCQKVVTGYGKIANVGRIEQYAMNSKWTCISTKDMNVSVYREASFIYNIQMKSETTCIGISPNFDLLVLGTKSCNIYFIELFGGSINHKLEMSAIPRKILVSPKWGFVLALCQAGSAYILSLYNVNGCFMTSIPFSSNIDAWCLFTSKKGFDYAAICCSNGDIYVFDIQNLAIGEPVFTGAKNITSVSFVPNHCSLVTTTYDGKFTLLPVIIPQ